MELLGLFIIIVIIGALAGGKYFGDTIRKGCGCLVILVIVVVIIWVIVVASNS